ncbi:hypothetical protein [Brevundimonas sp. SL161]|uniref:hypothetical protein n=1 Tax=Brevundimonas sp. SL161 TaxID=2804613 RepID=UPI003CF589FB
MSLSPVPLRNDCNGDAGLTFRPPQGADQPLTMTEAARAVRIEPQEGLGVTVAWNAVDRRGRRFLADDALDFDVRSGVGALVQDLDDRDMA